MHRNHQDFLLYFPIQTTTRRPFANECCVLRANMQSEDTKCIEEGLYDLSSKLLLISQKK